VEIVYFSFYGQSFSYPESISEKKREGGREERQGNIDARYIRVITFAMGHQ